MKSIRRFCPAFLALFCLCTLATSGGAEPAAEANARFEKTAGDYLQTYLSREPEGATQLGDHRFDGRLKDRSKAATAQEVTLTKAALAQLGEIARGELSKTNQVDFDILKNNLESTVFELETVRGWTWDPLNYNFANAIYLLIGRDFAPLATRLRSVASRLAGVPEVVAAARANLQHPPRIHVETALRQNAGAISLIRDGLGEFIDQAPEVRAEIAPAQEKAVAALTEYGRWLQDDLLPRADGDFRLGDANFRARLRYSLESDLPKEEILRRAQAALKQTQEDMYKTAVPLYVKFFPGQPVPVDAGRKLACKAVLDRLAESRPTNDTIVPNAKADLEAAREFVKAHDLVSVPPDPVNVVVMPEFQRGVSIAYCDAPGALAVNEATFYAIAPTPSDWDETRKTSFYREYNDHMLRDLTVHEAMPGHYLQLTTANRLKAPTLVRGVFISGMFAEGWATYAEQFMADAGFGGPEGRMEQLKMRLRLIINALLDQGIHTAGMTEAEAMKLMTEEGFQEEGEAAGKWRRACLTGAQLSTYFVGNTEVNDLANALRARKGRPLAPAEVRAMHDQMIAFGTAAPRYLRVLLGVEQGK